MRFLVFVGADYYPNGGADDLIGGADTEEQAEEIGRAFLRTREHGADWANMVDAETMRWRMITDTSDTWDWYEVT